MATFLCLLKQNIPLGCKDNKQPLEILDIFCNRYSNFLSKAFPIICYRKVLYTKVTKVFPVIAIAIPHNSVLLYCQLAQNQHTSHFLFHKNIFHYISDISVKVLKYGFCKKSLRKDAPLII